MGKRILFVRHAEIDLRHSGRYIGSSDVSLSDAGIRQAKELGQFLRSFGSGVPRVALASPMSRCRRTWQEMSIESIPDPLWDGDLKEADFGEWEERSFSEIQRSHPEEVEKWAEFAPEFRFPGGERLRTFIERMERVKTRLTALDEDVLVVSHGGVIATLICLFLDLSPSQYLLFRVERASLSSLEVFENGKAVLTGLNQLHSAGRKRVCEWPG